jgi:hypothetical protein
MATPEAVRYSDGGGLSAQGRAGREAVRPQAVGWFAEGVSVPEIARRLRVSQTAVYGWNEPPRHVRRLQTLGRLESCQEIRTSGTRLS